MPPVSSDLLANVLLPVGYLVGVVRTVLIVALGLVYAILVSGVCTLLVSESAKQMLHILILALQSPIRPLYRPVTHILTAVIARLVLFLVGIWWIPVVSVHRKRGGYVRTCCINEAAHAHFNQSPREDCRVRAMEASCWRRDCLKLGFLG